MKQWFMWCGIGPIVDLDDDLGHLTSCRNDDDALDRFEFRASRSPADWTLWARTDNQVRLMAIHRAGSGDLITFRGVK